jgi:hypothetical protein
MSVQDAAACRDCQYWEEGKIFVDTPQGPSRMGLCRRYPPQLLMVLSQQGQQPVAHFPATLALQSCGEFTLRSVIAT